MPFCKNVTINVTKTAYRKWKVGERTGLGVKETGVRKVVRKWGWGARELGSGHEETSEGAVLEAEEIGRGKGA